MLHAERGGSIPVIIIDTVGGSFRPFIQMPADLSYRELGIMTGANNRAGSQSWATGRLAASLRE